jgi:hypothetical protein
MDLREIGWEGVDWIHLSQDTDQWRARNLTKIRFQHVSLNITDLHLITGLGIFLFTTMSGPALGPTQPPIQWVPGALCLGVKRPGREADHSPPSSTEVKECVQPYLQSLNTPSWRDAQLKKKSTGTTSLLHCN